MILLLNLVVCLVIQLYDNEGNFNQALYDAPVVPQYFEQLRKQLETELHEHDDTTLLTQLTKVAMINSAQQQYNMNGFNVSGKVLNKLYTDVFNKLTQMGMGIDSKKNTDSIPDGTCHQKVV